MATKIIFNYPKMDETVTKLNGYKGEYEQAAELFLSAMKKATENWEGASKDKFITFVEGDVTTYIKTTVPGIVEGLANMLKSNSTQMQSADHQIANQLP